MSDRLYYLAYGSNLHPGRLTERISSAKLLSTVCLSGFQLAFHKTGQDNSGKCNLLSTSQKTDRVYAAVYTLERAHVAVLDEFEGNGRGYTDHPISVQDATGNRDCFTYLAQEAYIDDELIPFHWYKQLVLEGAEYLRFPATYIASIAATHSQVDLDRQRDKHHQQLLARMHTYPTPFDE